MRRKWFLNTLIKFFMLEIISYSFMQRAFLAGAILSGILALLGVFVLLRRMSFFADGVAHASLAGVAVGVFFSISPLLVALVCSVIFGLLIYFLERRFDFASDTAIGILFTAGMSIGVLVISVTPGYQPELFSFLFGSILSISEGDLVVMAVIVAVIAFFWLSNLQSLTLMALDEDSAKISGVKVGFLKPLSYVTLSVAVVLGVKVMGVLLVSALLILPVATAKFFAKSFKGFLIWSVILAEVNTFLGLVASYYFNLPSGPTIVVCGTIVFVLAALKRL